MTAPGATALKLTVGTDAIARITIDQPGSRANTLGQAVLAEWETVLTELEAKPGIVGLILHSGKPGMFIAGADLKELGDPRIDPDTARRIILRGLGIVARVEKLPFPTVAAIEGPCLGGGLELALGFDYRLASTHPKTEIGLPETKIGLIPGWGGTQRLTRLVGPSTAAELICPGDTVKAGRARELGIVFDAVPSERLLEEAARLLQYARESGSWQAERSKKQQPVGLSEEQLTFAAAVAKAMVLAKTKGQLPAPLAALEAIFGGCNLPLDEGLKIETDRMVPLVGSTISRNLIAIFFLTQKLGKSSGVTDPAVQPRPIQRVGVIGAGLMGAGIAGAHIRRGVPVTLLDNNTKAMEKGLASIAQVLQSRIAIGRMTNEEMLGTLSRLSSTGTLAALTDRDLVVEAIIEDEPTKIKLFRELQNILPPDAILASNTSTISITRMAQAVAKPENFAGLHFFNPVDRMPLVEVIRGEKTSDSTIATLVALVKQIGKSPIVVRDCPGFLVNRILFPYMNEAYALLEEGASPRDIDKAATDFGMPMGPILLSDVVGLDTALYAGKVVNTAFADRAKTTRIVGELVAAGRMGQKSGAGFYSYAKGPKGADDPALTPLLEKVRGERRTFTAEELTDRLFLPMVTEASRILMEGIVADAGEVDMGLILGIGFPPFRGGLLRWVDTVGTKEIVAKLRKYETLGKRYEPTEQLVKLAAEGKGFFPG
jgi:3-hydroxyacyl-CoA dehydrogenase/enoyl-CoA hydratase/3-hydroxybutyryl-CoA epimerase/3-hydroxyacyl-CoA dehydrogenase/enoyl-CoA hydratase/3-hydroxybutyryl-CoA epimerase/enoyl-CoA isomerase